MVGTIEKVSEQKHAGEVNTMVFDKDHLYSGGNDGCINVRKKRKLEFFVKIQNR